MCGIVGYVGEKNGVPVLVEGLKRMEYRGYDSSGITILNDKKLDTFKKKGKIKESFKTGDAMIFPAEPIWVHGTEPITKGTRYSINCFLQNHEPNKTSNEFII